MGLRKALVVGVIAGLAMGLSLFVAGALASRVVYRPQLASPGKFEPQQLNAWYFLWTKLVMGVVFGVLFTLLYELLPLARRMASVTAGLTYAAGLWLVVSLWGLSHPLVYGTVSVRDELFWLVYTLAGFLDSGRHWAWRMGVTNVVWLAPEAAARAGSGRTGRLAAPRLSP